MNLSSTSTDFPNPLLINLSSTCVTYNHIIGIARLQVVLDLDETLVCAYESSSLPAALRAEAVEAGLHCFDMECISAEKASKLPSFSY